MLSPLIVVGMHRSGTSFVAALLQAAGLDMGERLMAAARGNERGHFENMDFVEFHMHWLRMTGHDDAGWTTLQPLTLPQEAVAEANAVLENNARTSPWGWKDPRTTLFLDFWSRIVSDAKYIFVYREPSEVIDSLYRRGDDSIHRSPELAARAYLSHNEEMLRYARLHRAQSVIANVSEIARDPEHFLAAVTEKLGINLNVHVPPVFEGELMRSIAPDAPRATLLRHLVPEIDRLYATLEREADLPSASAHSKRASIDKVKEAFFAGWRLDAEREGEQKKNAIALSSTSVELERLRLTAVEREAELTDALAQHDAELRMIRDELGAADASNVARGEHLAEAERLLLLERAQRAEVQERRDEALTELAHLRATIVEFKDGLEARRMRIAELETQIEEARTRNQDLEKQTEGARAHIQNLEERLEHGNRELITQTEALIAATRAESEQISHLISIVQSSSFWKLKRGISRVLRTLHLAPR